MKRVRFTIFLLFVALFTTAIAKGKQPKKSIFTRTRIQLPRTEAVNLAPSQGTILHDVTYCKAGGTALKMDVYIPANRNARPAPALLYVHGGAWIFGDKTQGPGIDDIVELLARGYLVFSINYRLAPLSRFPAQIEDCKCAVRSLRANASQYKIDASRIGVWGSSAGGHLAALLGTTAGIGDFEGSGGYPEQSSRVQAVATYFAPSDLTTSDWSLIDKLGFLTVFGISKNWKKASPVNYVNHTAPPFFVLGGDRDHLVDIRQPQGFYTKLQVASVPSQLLIVKNCEHEFEPDGGALNPSRLEVTKRLADFFDKNIRLAPAQNIEELSGRRIESKRAVLTSN